MTRSGAVKLVALYPSHVLCIVFDLYFPNGIWLAYITFNFLDLVVACTTTWSLFPVAFIVECNDDDFQLGLGAVGLPFGRGRSGRRGGMIGVDQPYVKAWEWRFL